MTRGKLDGWQLVILAFFGPLAFLSYGFFVASVPELGVLNTNLLGMEVFSVTPTKILMMLLAGVVLWTNEWSLKWEGVGWDLLSATFTGFLLLLVFVDPIIPLTDVFLSQSVGGLIAGVLQSITLGWIIWSG